MRVPKKKLLKLAKIIDLMKCERLTRYFQNASKTIKKGVDYALYYSAPLNIFACKVKPPDQYNPCEKADPHALTLARLYGQANQLNFATSLRELLKHGYLDTQGLLGQHFQLTKAGQEMLHRLDPTKLN